jgi:peptidoglycan/xylan/chitin deacetylase (PgdA/CDA1 family)
LTRVITRRSFAVGLAAASIAAAKAPQPQVAITIDDFQWKQIPQGGAEQANHRLLDALGRHSNLKAAIFVCGKHVANETGRRLVRSWSDAGHLIGNHSFSHVSYNSSDASFAPFSRDVLRGEHVISGLPGFQKMFRFPFLKEGDTAVKRDQMRAFLTKHGYRNGHVTIDASDWYYDQRLRARLEKNPGVDTRPYRDPYLAHLLDRATYYDGLAKSLTGRAVSHTILLHYTLLNSLFLDEVLSMFEAKGWQLISAQAAFQDPVFSNSPRIVPAGESLIWAMAKESGKFDGRLRYPGEDGEYEKDKLDRLGL